MYPRKVRKRSDSILNTAFINQVIAALKSDPSKLAVIQKNLEQYRSQRHLKRGVFTRN